MSSHSFEWAQPVGANAWGSGKAMQGRLGKKVELSSSSGKILHNGYASREHGFFSLKYKLKPHKLIKLVYDVLFGIGSKGHY